MIWLYLTGAQGSIAKSAEQPQPDPTKSLGGFVSSTLVPNNSINSLFDIVSQLTIEKRLPETIAIGLINGDSDITDIELKIITDNHYQCDFMIAAVGLDESFCMEHISSRYQEPLNATFHDATFYRAFVELEVKKSASVGEVINLQPFDVFVEVSESGIEGTWKAFEEAFSDDVNYCVKRISEKVFRIENRAENVVVEPITCSYINSGNFEAEFLGKYENVKSNSVSLGNLEKGKGIGLWLQRKIKKTAYKTNEELIEMYKKKEEVQKIEKPEIIISYNE